MTTLLEHLTELDWKATKGPWRWDDGTLEQDVSRNNGEIILGFYDEGSTFPDERDQQIIAATRNALPDFIAAVGAAHEAWKVLDDTAYSPDVADRLGAALAPFLKEIAE